MLIKRPSDIKPSEIMPRGIYMRRRELLKSAGFLAAAGFAGVGSGPASAQAGAKLPAFRKSSLSTTEKPNSFKDVSSYNNYYEFGTDKSDPAENARALKVRPWTVVVEGEVKKPKTFGIEDLLKLSLEERIYRMRCVEAWSMVIPWVGISLASVIKRFEPQGSAKFVRFETIVRPTEMRGQRSANLPWPYIEGLRMDEAMNPLAILAVGLYGQPLPGQNGAPIRLVVPWKYGFKGVKSIVRISFVEDQPQNTWKVMNGTEYGFYANVNPKVDHPRWSQASERRIGEFRRRPTLMFNGYEEEVADLYKGMNLSRLY